MPWRIVGRLVAVAVLLALPLAGCDDQQSAEKTGQEIGRAVDQAAERVGEVTDDLAARAGRAMQGLGTDIERAAREANRPEERREPAQ